MTQNTFSVILLALLSCFTGGSVGLENTCEYGIVETQPDSMNFSANIGFQPVPTHEALIDLIDSAKKTLRIASFYVTLSAEPDYASHPSAAPGKRVLEAIVAAVDRGVDLEVVIDHSTKRPMNELSDIQTLESIGKLRFLNMTKFFQSGVMHSKFLIADNQSLYLGSANFDWRSYTQVKELGIKFDRCHTVAADLDKIFQTYMYLSEVDEMPAQLPAHLNTAINEYSPLNLKLDQLNSTLFLGSSPQEFNGLEDSTDRTEDIEGLLKIIEKARRHIDISVMNYSPRTEFLGPKKLWPRIDDALRRAATERGVRVRLLFSRWSKSSPMEQMWYRSLNAIQNKYLRGGGIYVKLYQVPAFDDFQEKLPWARVKHDKYIVTDNGLYIGTSNFAPEYFINTCGVGLVIEPKAKYYKPGSKKSIIEKMQALFERDYLSEYSHDLD